VEKEIRSLSANIHSISEVSDCARIIGRCSRRPNLGLSCMPRFPGFNMQLRRQSRHTSAAYAAYPIMPAREDDSFHCTIM
jgi:hypothetical protein